MEEEGAKMLPNNLSVWYWLDDHISQYSHKDKHLAFVIVHLHNLLKL